VGFLILSARKLVRVTITFRVTERSDCEMVPLRTAALLLVLLWLPRSASPALAPPVVNGMRSIGVAVKQARLYRGVEKTVFEHTLSASASYGAMTQAWHAGSTTGMTPTFRVRYYGLRGRGGHRLRGLTAEPGARARAGAA
jgi:hypothetical protein